MDSINIVKEVKPSSHQYEKVMELNNKYKIISDKNQKLEQEIERQQNSLLKHQELIEKNQMEKIKIKEKLEKYNNLHSSSSKKQSAKKPDGELNIEQLKHQIEVLTNLIQEDEKQFYKKKAKAETKLKSTKKELEVMNLKVREKEQEFRIGNLKLKELKRIIKQNKL